MRTIISTLALAIVLASCSTSNVQQPEYRDIREVRLIELGILQSTAGIDAIFYNPNNFGVKLTDARGDVYIDNAYLGRFSIDDAIKVDRRSEFVIPAIVKLDMIGAVKNHRELWKKKEALIRIEGIARVTKAGFSKEIPIKYESMQNIERFRALVSR